jgi:excisionase family DNA binding protein
MEWSRNYMANKNHTDKGIKKAQGLQPNLVKRLLTLKEAAEYLGRSEWGMRDLIWSRTIPVVKMSGARKYYLDIHDLNVFVEKNKSVCR